MPRFHGIQFRIGRMCRGLHLLRFRGTQRAFGLRFEQVNLRLDLVGLLHELGRLKLQAPMPHFGLDLLHGCAPLLAYLFHLDRQRRHRPDGHRAGRVRHELLDL